MSPSKAEFQLIYWPGIPGRGEHIRLALEEAGVPYIDRALKEDGEKVVMDLVGTQNVGDAQNPPIYAIPALQHGDVVLSQTPNILAYLGEQFREKLVPQLPGSSDAAAKYHVNGLALTVLDTLSNEVHDCHHPCGGNLYYEDQKAESLRRSKDYIANRLPKILEYFQRVLSSPASGDGPWLYAGQISYADLVLFQGIDGTKHQFPKAMKKAEASVKYNKVFELHQAVKERPNIKAYLASDRRQKYANGIYRYYAELDIE